MIQTFLLEARTKKLTAKPPTLGAMAEDEKGVVPDELKDAIADNLKGAMRRELYDPEDPDDIKRLAHHAGVHVRSIERLLRRDTYPDNQPSLKTLASLAIALRVETHQLVYKPRVTGEYRNHHKSAGNSAQRNPKKTRDKSGNS